MDTNARDSEKTNGEQPESVAGHSAISGNLRNAVPLGILRRAYNWSMPASLTLRRPSLAHHQVSGVQSENACSDSILNHRCSSIRNLSCKRRDSRCENRSASTILTVRYCCTQQYSITALTDSNAVIKERYAYDAYGGLSIFDGSGTARTSTAEGNRYTYTGREYDDALDLNHYRARMYDSIAGRFLSRDPIGYVGSQWNTYNYTGSNPVRRVDPSGKRQFECRCRCTRYDYGDLEGAEHDVTITTISGENDAERAAETCSDFCSQLPDSPGVNCTGSLLSSIRACSGPMKPLAFPRAGFLNSCEGIVNRFADLCGVNHSWLEDINSGHGWGFTGGNPRPDGNRITTQCQRCARTSQTLKHGPGANKEVSR